jgi:hypothetical protein
MNRSAQELLCDNVQSLYRSGVKIFKIFDIIDN